MNTTIRASAPTGPRRGCQTPPSFKALASGALLVITGALSQGAQAATVTALPTSGPFTVQGDGVTTGTWGALLPAGHNEFSGNTTAFSALINIAIPTNPYAPGDPLGYSVLSLMDADPSATEQVAIQVSGQVGLNNLSKLSLVFVGPAIDPTAASSALGAQLFTFNPADSMGPPSTYQPTSDGPGGTGTVVIPNAVQFDVSFNGPSGPKLGTGSAFTVDIGSIQLGSLAYKNWALTNDGGPQPFDIYLGINGALDDLSQVQDFPLQAPIPTAVWLLGSALCWLFGMNRARRA